MSTKAHDGLWLGSGIQPTRIFCLVSASLLVYDHLCTLDREVKLIWKSRLGRPATVLFLINRYLPYFYVFSAIRDYWSVAKSQQECRRREIGSIVPIALSLILSELILVLRTWAIWERSRVILGLFMGLWTAKGPVTLLAFYHIIHDGHFINISPTEVFCISPVLGNWSWETLCFIMVLITETIIAFLTLLRTVQARRYGTSKWVIKILYMGIIYYFYDLLMTIFGLVGTLYLHNMGTRSFGVLQGTLQSILCSRIIFLVRSPSELAISSNETNTLSTLRIGGASSGQTETEGGKDAA